MFKFSLKKQKTSIFQCALSISAEGIWFIAIRATTDHPLEMVHREFIPCRNEFKEQKKQLKAFVQKLKLTGATCQWVLEPSQYQTFLLTPPKVNPEEMTTALKWQLPQVTDIPISEALIEVIPLPTTQPDEVNKMVYVVVAKKKEILNTVSAIEASGLKLSAIGIAELALRNVMAFLPEDLEGSILATNLSGQRLLLVCQNKLLQLTRRISIDYPGVSDRGTVSTMIPDVGIEAFGLRMVEEIRRSFDYCVNTLELAAPKHILLLNWENSLELKQVLSKTFQRDPKDLGEQVFLGQVFDSHEPHYLLALGALLK